MIYCWRKNELQESGAVDKHQVSCSSESSSETLALLTLVNTLRRS
jgi:hypothetical protein